jgi:hypothetical protein
MRAELTVPWRPVVARNNEEQRGIAESTLSINSPTVVLTSLKRRSVKRIKRLDFPTPVWPLSDPLQQVGAKKAGGIWKKTKQPPTADRPRKPLALQIWQEQQQIHRV